MSIDARVARIAARQHTLIARSQCLAHGLSDEAIGHRVRSGRWTRVHRGVYAVGHAALTPQGRYLAGVLAGGPGTLLGLRSATSHWALQPHHGGPVHTTSARKQRGRPGIEHHWTRRLDPADARVRHGSPSPASPARSSTSPTSRARTSWSRRSARPSACTALTARS